MNLEREVAILETREDGCSCQEANCCVPEVGEMVRKLVRMFQLFERDQIKVHGFTTSQCYTLLEIARAGTVTMNDLSERMNLSSSTMTRILDNLVRDGYILRQRSDSDRRVVIVALTAQGEASAAKLNDSVNAYYRKVIESIPQGKLDEVLHSADLLTRAFEQSNPNCC